MTDQAAKLVAIEISGRMCDEVVWAVEFDVYTTFKGQETRFKETRWCRSYHNAVANALLTEGAIVRKVTFSPSDPCRPSYWGEI